MSADFINGKSNASEQDTARGQCHTYNIVHMSLLTHYIWNLQTTLKLVIEQQYYNFKASFLSPQI